MQGIKQPAPFGYSLAYFLYIKNRRCHQNTSIITVGLISPFVLQFNRLVGVSGVRPEFIKIIWLAFQFIIFSANDHDTLFLTSNDREHPSDEGTNQYHKIYSFSIVINLYSSFSVAINLVIFISRLTFQMNVKVVHTPAKVIFYCLIVY